MIDWLSATRWRMPIVALIYFSLHVAARCFVSPSLDYDESEQVFLAQCLSYGYNSQPPLYTWVQTGFFEIFGLTVFALAALKNLLLFGTYILVFGIVCKATDNVGLAAVATLGLLTIPQISWESHRDLSHTVSATFATVFTLYSVVSLAIDNRTRWYLLLGFATALGILSKYNFAIVIVGFIVAGLTVPTYRRKLIDRRMTLAVGLAGALILPHVIWMGSHLDLISSKTIATMTKNQSNEWLLDVGAGFTALAISALGCCAITLVTFSPGLYGSWKKPSMRGLSSSDDSGHATTLLVERFLITITIVLCMLVLSGHALEFKNRWLQPFVVLLPTYIVLRVREFLAAERQTMNRACAVALLLMFAILTAIITRPLIGRYRHKYCWLNISYSDLAATIREQTGNTPAILVASNMRIAGNLRIQFPDSYVITRDQPYLTARMLGMSRKELQTCDVVMVTDRTHPCAKDELLAFGRQALNCPAGSPRDWRQINVEYLYGTEDASQPFVFSKLGIEHVAANASSTELKMR